MGAGTGGAASRRSENERSWLVGELGHEHVDGARWTVLTLRLPKLAAMVASNPAQL